MFLSSGYSSNSPLRRIFMSVSLVSPTICINAVMASATEVKFAGKFSNSDKLFASFSLIFLMISGRVFEMLMAWT
ncbi:hypothetical protein VIGAN_01258800 [Vigna angularis var. angularis]|uniref:Uncharacterized protein n=1 Tax=Vigna angularis var. angularis TaxID=157739 RepID=A0A0S3R2R7_PHAAN|nr:hypothetical protein VIGAN_01258800 [Vigna angularis var. angularis]